MNAKRSARLHFKHSGPIKAGETFTVEAKARLLFRGYSKIDLDPIDLWIVGAKIGNIIQRPNVPPEKADQFTSVLHAGNFQYDSLGPGSPCWSLTFRTDRDLSSFSCVMYGDTHADEKITGPIDVTDYGSEP